MILPEEESLIDPTEREIAERLERYDAAMRSGHRAPVSGTDPDGLSAGAIHRLSAACAALDLLRQARGSAATPVRPRIAGYEVLEVLGRGGMGIVYKARDLALGRLVALKLVVAGIHAESVDLARFRAEAEAVARLDHPNIVRIYEVGQQEQDGGPVPYMALELVEGGSLAAQLDGTPQPLRSSAALVESLARAVDYAHARGIVHRDLKPANILLGGVVSGGVVSGGVVSGGVVSGGVVSGGVVSGGVVSGGITDLDHSPLTTHHSPLTTPKIADFGLAKRLGDKVTRHTVTGAVLGTAQYMAPEQAAGRNHLVGPATDIYALGAILYQMLTGRPPFAGEMPTDILIQVLHEEPVSLQRLRPQMSRDLETICLKCLQKEPGKRYATAGALADDLRRYLDGQPIEARPIGPSERLWRWARRRPVVASLSAALAVVTLLSIVLIGWQWRVAVGNANEATANAAAEAKARLEEAEARRDADRKTREVEVLLLGADIDRAVTFCERGDMAMGLLWLARCLPVAVRLQEADLERVIRINLAGWRSHFSRLSGTLPHHDWVWDVAFSHDGRFVLTGSKDRKVRLWDALTCQLQGPAMDHPWPVWSAAFSPDGRLILSGCGTEDGKQGDARLWDVATRRLLATLPTGALVEYAAFDRSGKWILTRGDRKVHLWKAPGAGEEIVLPPVELAHPGRIYTALFSPDGRSVLTGGSDGVVRLWDTATGQPQGVPLRHPGAVFSAAFRPDGQGIAAGVAVYNADGNLAGGEVRLWEIAGNKPVAAPLPHKGPPLSLAFSPDGRMLLAGGAVLPTNGGPTRGEARLYDAQRAAPLGPVLDHGGSVRIVAFSPDGRTFVTGDAARYCTQWQTATCLPLASAAHQHGTVRSAAFSPDGRRYVCGSASNDPQVQLREAARGLAVGPPMYHPSAVTALGLSADGKLLVAGCADGTTWLWDPRTRQSLRTLTGQRGEVVSVSASADGSHVVSATYHGTVQLWNSGTGQAVGEPLRAPVPVNCVAFRPDGTSYAIGHYDPNVAAQCRQVPEGKKLIGFPHPVGVGALAYAADGHWLLTGGVGGIYRWDLGSGKLLDRHLTQGGNVNSLAVSPDGRWVVSSTEAQAAYLWETTTGRRFGPPLPHQEVIVAVAVSRDGRLILTGSADKTARVWDSGTGKPLTPPLVHRDRVIGVAFLPDGKHLVTGSRDQTVQFWELPEPVRDSPVQVRADMDFLTGMELDEHGTIRPLSANDRLARRR